MGDKTAIQWTEATWNPVRGCSRVSEGCRNCYAERVASRFSGPGLPYEGLAANGKWTGNTRLVESALDQPLRWKSPRRIFVNSMSDLFHESLSNEQIAAVFNVMGKASHHTFQVLTKRPARMLDWFRWERDETNDTLREINASAKTITREKLGLPWPLPNVWLGVSVENQAAADERIPLLLETPAAVRYLSCEPLLGPVELRSYLRTRYADWDPKTVSERIIPPVDWVIAGGESGPGARPCHPDWARSLRDQCAAAAVPYFFKQWGEWAPDCLCLDKAVCATTPRVGAGVMFRCGKRAAGRLLDGREHSEFPS